MRKCLILASLLLASSLFAEKVEVSTEGKFCRLGYGNYFDNGKDTMFNHALPKSVRFSKFCFEGKVYLIVGNSTRGSGGMAATGESCSCGEKKEVPLESGKEKTN